MKLLILIPAFNEGEIIGRVLSSIPSKLPEIEKIEIAVINDGSTDKTATVVKTFKNVVLLDHFLNLGIGACWQTGFEYAKNHNFDLVVTMDADGQHNPAEITRLLRPILARKADLVLGSRLKYGRMPFDRKFLNFLANFYTFFLFGLFVSDSQTGFRSLSKKAYSQINLTTSRMEAASEMFGEIVRNKLKVTEVAITPIYTKYSRLKGQKNLNAFSVGARLLFRFLTS